MENNLKKIYKILLAEDDTSSANLVMHTLGRYNFHIYWVEDGMAALTKIRSQKYDLVISDIQMPYMDGLVFIEKAKEYLKTVPVIVLTASADKENVLRAGSSRVVQSYLVKPIEPPSLMAKVFSLLHVQESDLFDKKDHPFKIIAQEISSIEVGMKVIGCPRKKNVEEFYEKLKLFTDVDPKKVNLRMDIDRDFFYELTALEILDEFLAKVYRNTNIRSNGVFIHAPILAKIGVNLEKYSNLNDANLKLES